MRNRVEGCALIDLEDALYRQKTLLQAWSFRGAPFVFPTGDRDVFLSALAAREGEQPWIYTLGITGALDFLQMPFEDLLARTKSAAEYLDAHTVKSKESLDKILAGIVEAGLPPEKQALWQKPSMYDEKGRQSVGEAAVSFLLRPCAFFSLVVFGERQGLSPTFTSLKSWVGEPPQIRADAEKELVRRFLRCYGPATVDSFMSWLGSSKRQALRLWSALSDEMTPVEVCGKAAGMLSADMDSLLNAELSDEKLVLLGAHDPYLDMRDREVILENKAFHKHVWKLVANPGAVLKGGQVVGTWKGRTEKDRLTVSASLWERALPRERHRLEALAEEYALFRGLKIKSCVIESP